ncbi:MAG TPA: DUF952 domain-containing protein [Stellaceae bacterium]|nr:DUF952 domain-containing protein [Stellaceae bacterium]
MCRQDEWQAALARGRYDGSSQDRADGFIHFSTASQLPQSAAKHRAGQGGLIVIAVVAETLGAALKWEESRNGALFPHLYGALIPDRVLWVAEAPLGPDGTHRLPPLA